MNTESNTTTLTDELLSHSDALYNFALKLTKNPTDAEDLFQETYYKIVKYKHYFKEGTNSRAWAFRIMQNNFINNYRKASRIPKEFDIQTVYMGASFSSGINSKMLKTSISDELTYAINNLQDHLKTAMLLCDVEDFSYKEIAKIMDIPIGTVKTYIHKARQSVKMRLQDAKIHQAYRMSA